MLSMGSPTVSFPDFAPPSDYAFEPELAGAPPRALPEHLTRGPYGRARRQRLLVILGAGFVCLVVSGLVRLATPHISYLPWVVSVAIAAAVLSHLRERSSGPYRYVREGLPVAARVVELAMGPSVFKGQEPAAYAFTAVLLYRHPASGAFTAAKVKSEDFSPREKDRYEAPFKVGDYATAVYLPSRLEESLRLYAFLDLSPAVNIRRRNG
jgi:hypothetical protein